jgi:hypothetical protein
METHDDARRAALESLNPFVGEWSVSASFAPAALRARTVFEWTLDGRFLTQRSEIEHPDAPDSLSIIAFDAATQRFTQHYFDSRGVVRLYAMTFADGVWTLLRTSPDFSPVDFSQRFTGTFSPDGATIEGRWETSTDGSSWERDFDLVYTRLG